MTSRYQRIWMELESGQHVMKTEDIPESEVYGQATGIDAISGVGWSLSGVTISDAGREHTITLQGERDLGAKMERERILALMRELRPLDSVYTRRDWAIEQKAQKELLDKLLKAVESGRQPKKAGQ